MILAVVFELEESGAKLRSYFGLVRRREDGT